MPQDEEYYLHPQNMRYQEDSFEDLAKGGKTASSTCNACNGM